MAIIAFEATDYTQHQAENGNVVMIELVVTDTIGKADIRVYKLLPSEIPRAMQIATKSKVGKIGCNGLPVGSIINSVMVLDNSIYTYTNDELKSEINRGPANDLRAAEVVGHC